MKYGLGDIVRRNFGPRNVGIVVKATAVGDKNQYLVQDDAEGFRVSNYGEDELDIVFSKSAYLKITESFK